MSSRMPTYKEPQILDKVCKVARQKQIKYYDFIPFFDFQYEKKYFQLSALPLFSLLRGPCFHFPFSLSKSSMNLNLAVSWLINLKKNLEFDSIFVSNSNSQWPALQLA